MPLATNLIQLGVPTEQASRLGYEDLVPLAGNGTTQGTATAIDRYNTNVATETAVGQTAFRLPAEAELMQPYFIANQDATEALVYPPVGAFIDDGSINAAKTIAQDRARVFVRVSGGYWASFIAGDDTALGTVTSVSVATANGFGGTVSNPTTTPQITITTPGSPTFGGTVTATSAFIGAGNVTLATTGANTVFVRPNGSLSGIGQVTLDAAGDLRTSAAGTNAASVVTVGGVQTLTNKTLTAPTMTTPTLGAASATTLVFSPSTGGIIGTTLANNTNAGNVGEIITSTIASGSAVPLTNNTPANVTSISLTPGDWNVFGTVSFSSAASTSITQWIQSISQTSATLDTNPPSFAVARTNAIVPGLTTLAHAFSTMSVRVSVAANTTVFLVAQSAFTVSTLSAYGAIWARRAR